MASNSGTGENEVFDASKQAKTPFKYFSLAPRDTPAVRVGFVGRGVGYGLFAARDFARDEFIFHEAPLMTALFNEKFAADAALAQSQVCACRGALFSRAHGDVAALAFPALAARFGIPPPDFDQAAPATADGDGDYGLLLSGLGRNLVPGHGRFAGSSVTRHEYEAYTARFKTAAAATASEADTRDACLDFFKAYAFQVQPTGVGVNSGSGSTLMAGATREACVYLLGSLINHCCTPSAPPSRVSSLSKSGGNRGSSRNGSDTTRGPNCCWRIGPSGLAHFVKPRHICAQARRPIREGEQLTWDYGKREKGFECECSVCRDSFMGGLGYQCGVL